jgi:hypothetical protein
MGNWAVLQVDLKNAFNTLDRTVLLQEAQTRTPALFNYLRFAYGQPAHLFSDGRVLPSTRGTHQGCPLGPIGFAVGLQTIAETIAQQAELLWSSWYLDDGLLIGEPAMLQKCLDFLRLEGERTGVQLNLAKCVAWGPAAARIPGREHLQLVPWTEGSGITVLGCPVDFPTTTGHTAAAWAEATGRIEKATDLVTSVSDPQLAHHLLRSCLDGCKVNHLLRASDSYEAQEEVARCGETIFIAFEDILGRALNADQRQQAALPLSAGGCGLRIPAACQGAARTAALCHYYTHGHKKVACPAYVAAPSERVCQQPANDLCSTLGPQHPESQRLLTTASFASGSGNDTSQRWWQTQLSRTTVDGLLSRIPARDQARLMEQAHGIGHGWMVATPNEALHTTIDAADYRLGLSW